MRNVKPSAESFCCFSIVVHCTGRTPRVALKASAGASGKSERPKRLKRVVLGDSPLWVTHLFCPSFKLYQGKGGTD
jgi:hypothetical protein